MNGEERDSIQEAHETKKACDRKRYKANFEGDSVKAYCNQNRELNLASKQAQYQANPKEKKSYEVGVYRLGAICPSLFTRKGTVYPLRVFLQSSASYNVICTPPPPPPPPQLSTLCKLADGLLALVGLFISEFC